MSGSPQRKSGFDPGPVSVQFVVDKMAVKQIFLGVLLFFL
jgi:hypothetical protein